MQDKINKTSVEIRTNSVTQVGISIGNGVITNSEVTIESLTPLASYRKCEIVDAIFVGGKYKDGSGNTINNYNPFGITSGIALAKEISTRLAKGGTGVSLGQYGRLLLRFSPPLLQKSSDDFIIKFDRTLPKENFTLTLGNILKYYDPTDGLHPKGKKIIPLQVPDHKSQAGWKVNEVLSQYNLKTNHAGSFLNQSFEWVEFEDGGYKLSEQLRDKPGLDLKDLEWTCSPPPMDIAIAIDSSGSMRDNDAGTHYRSEYVKWKKAWEVWKAAEKRIPSPSPEDLEKLRQAEKALEPSTVEWDMNLADADQRGKNQLYIVASRSVRVDFLLDGALTRNDLNFWLSYFESTKAKFYYFDRNSAHLDNGDTTGISPDIVRELREEWRIDDTTDDKVNYSHCAIKKLVIGTSPLLINPQNVLGVRDSLNHYREGHDYTHNDVLTDWKTGEAFVHNTPLKTAIVDTAKVLLAHLNKSKLMIIITDGKGTQPNETISVAQSELNGLLDKKPGTVIGNENWEGVIELVGYKIFPDSERTAFFNFAPLKWTVFIHEVNKEAELRSLLEKLRKKYQLN